MPLESQSAGLLGTAFGGVRRAAAGSSRQVELGARIGARRSTPDIFLRHLQRHAGLAGQRRPADAVGALAPHIEENRPGGARWLASRRMAGRALLLVEYAYCGVVAL